MEDGVSRQLRAVSFRLPHSYTVARTVVYCTAAGMYVCSVFHTLSSAYTGTIPGSRRNIFSVRQSGFDRVHINFIRYELQKSSN